MYNKFTINNVRLSEYRQRFYRISLVDKSARHETNLPALINYFIKINQPVYCSLLASYFVVFEAVTFVDTLRVLEFTS